MRPCNAHRIARAAPILGTLVVLAAPPALAATPFVHETVVSSGVVGNYCSLALDAQGNPHVTFQDATQGLPRYGVKRDGIWTTEFFDFTTFGLGGEYTSLALDAAGRPHISYYDVANGDLRYATRVNEVWVLETVDAPGNVGQYTSIALDGQGRPAIAYYDAGNADLKFASKATGSWVVETVLGMGDMGRYASLALDALGNPRISFFDATSSRLWYASRLGGAWNFDLVDASGNVGQYSSLALDAQGNPHISYFDGFTADLKYARRGASWVIETVDAMGVLGLHTSLALDGQGRPSISYQDGNNLDLKFATKVTGSWVVETIDALGNAGNYSSLALDAEGSPHIVHMDFDAGDLRHADAAVHIVSPAGGERWATGSQQTVRWSGAGIVSIDISADGGATFSTLRSDVGVNEVPVVVPAFTTDQAVVRIRRASPYATSTSGTLSIAPDLVDPWWTRTVASGGSHPSLAIDVQGNPRISFVDEVNDDLAYATRSGGTWSFETVDAGNVANETSLALDAQGNPRIAYHDFSGLRFASRDGGVWSLETVDASVVSQYTSLQLDAQGNPGIAYWDLTNDNLRYASKSGGMWIIQTVASAGDVGRHPSLAFDAEGNPHISYRDATVPALKYARRVGGTWTIEVVDASNSPSYTSLALDGQGDPHIAYYDGAFAHLKYATRSGGAWTVQTVDGSDLTALYVSLALDARDTPRISYWDGSDLRYASERGGRWALEVVDAPGNVGHFTSLALDAQGNPHIGYVDATAFPQMVLKYASAAIELAQPVTGTTWPVGATRRVAWDGTGRVDLSLSVDGGRSWQLLQSRLSGGEYTLVVPHSPTRFAQLKLERQLPSSVSATPGLFTIETSVALLSFAAQAAPAGGADLSWASDPGPADLAGYRIERAGSSGWNTLVAMTRETSYHDPSGEGGARYRLSAINGLGEELVLGEAFLLPRAPLAAWPLPYSGGDLTVSFAAPGGLGGGAGETAVELYDLSGRHVRTIARGAYAAGYHSASWDGRDEGGRSVGSGVYFLRARSLGHDERLRVLVIR